MTGQQHWTMADRDTQPERCHLCGTENVPLTNYSRDHGGYQGPHWMCELCEFTRSASRIGAGFHRDEWATVVADVAAMLHYVLAEIRRD